MSTYDRIVHLARRRKCLGARNSKAMLRLGAQAWARSDVCRALGARRNSGSQSENVEQARGVTWRKWICAQQPLGLLPDG